MLLPCWPVKVSSQEGLHANAVILGQFFVMNCALVDIIPFCSAIIVYNFRTDVISEGMKSLFILTVASGT